MKMLYIEQNAIEMSPNMLNSFYISISLINGLMPQINKRSAEPMLTEFYDAIWLYWSSMS